MIADAQNRDPAEIVAAMAAGDSGPALSAFYAQYASMVLALLMKMLGSRAEAEEILQEVFVELAREIGLDGGAFASCLAIIPSSPISPGAARSSR